MSIAVRRAVSGLPSAVPFYVDGSDELRHFGEVTIDFRHLRLQLAAP